MTEPIKDIFDKEVLQELEVLPKDAPAYAFDLDLFLYRDYKNMQRAKFYEVYGFVEPLITRWNFSVPLTEGAMKKLPVADGAGIFAKIMEALNEDVEKTEKTVKVDFSLKNWTMETIEQLVGYEEAGKWDKVAELVLGIVRFPKVQPKVDSLRAVDGQAAFNAIMTKWQGVLQGKN